MGGGYMKKLKYIYTAILFVLIVTLSFSWRGILDMYRSSYNSDPSLPIMKNYSILKGRYSFQIPGSWRFVEGITGGSEVRYSGDFNSPDSKVRGLVQVWNINVSLKDFLEKSKFSSVGIDGLQNYTLKPFQFNGIRGYVLTYLSPGNDNVRYQAVEYFAPVSAKEFFRISFYTKEQDYNEAQRKLYDSIALTLRIKN
jgi:hypothetical protein